MTFEEYMAARQLLAEERIGTRLREQVAQEDTAFDAARKHLGAA